MGAELGAAATGVEAPVAAALPPAVRGALWGGLAVLIWGGYLAMARASVAQGWQASDIALLRYATAGALLLPWLLRRGVADLAGVGWGRGAVLALLAGPGFILLGAGGYAFAPLAHGAVLQPAALTLGGLALGAWVLGERPGRAHLAGTAAILVGLALVAGPGLLAGSATALVGDAMFLAAGAMWAGFGVLSRRWRVGAVAGAAAVAVLSAVAFVPGYLLLVGTGRLLAATPGALLLQVGVQGVLAGVVAVIAYGRAVQLLGAGGAATFPALVPAVAIGLGIPVTGEWPLGHQALGLAVATFGLGLAMGIWRHRAG